MNAFQIRAWLSEDTKAQRLAMKCLHQFGLPQAAMAMYHTLRARGVSHTPAGDEITREALLVVLREISNIGRNRIRKAVNGK